ncbi:MAG: hypothetical protein C0475_07490 [Planctomyces sp.]|nr:hypothetical protein [Planctomyces sp.]
MAGTGLALGKVTAAQRRLAAASAIGGAVRGALAGGCAAVTLGPAAAWAGWHGLAWGMVALAPAGCAAAGAAWSAWAWVGGRARLRSAVMLDAACGTGDALATGLQLDVRGPERAQGWPADALFRQAAVDRAGQVAPSVDPRRVAALRLGRGWSGVSGLIAACLCATAAGVGVWAVPQSDPAEVERATAALEQGRLRARAEEAARAVERVRRVAQNAVEGTPLSQAERRLAEELGEIERELGAGGAQTGGALNRAAQRTEQAARELLRKSADRRGELDALRATLARAAARAAPGGQGDDADGSAAGAVREALARGDTRLAAQAAADLRRAAPSMTPEERQRAARSLEELAEIIERDRAEPGADQPPARSAPAGEPATAESRASTQESWSGGEQPAEAPGAAARDAERIAQGLRGSAEQLRQQGPAGDKPGAAEAPAGDRAAESGTPARPVGEQGAPAQDRRSGAGQPSAKPSAQATEQAQPPAPPTGTPAAPGSRPENGAEQGRGTPQAQPSQPEPGQSQPPTGKPDQPGPSSPDPSGAPRGDSPAGATQPSGATQPGGRDVPGAQLRTKPGEPGSRAGGAAKDTQAGEKPAEQPGPSRAAPGGATPRAGEGQPAGGAQGAQGPDRQGSDQQGRPAVGSSGAEQGRSGGRATDASAGNPSQPRDTQPGESRPGPAGAKGAQPGAAQPGETPPGAAGSRERAAADGSAATPPEAGKQGGATTPEGAKGPGESGQQEGVSGERPSDVPAGLEGLERRLQEIGDRAQQAEGDRRRARELQDEAQRLYEQATPEEQRRVQEQARRLAQERGQNQGQDQGQGQGQSEGQNQDQGTGQNQGNGQGQNEGQGQGQGGGQGQVGGGAQQPQGRGADGAGGGPGSRLRSGQRGGGAGSADSAVGRNGQGLLSEAQARTELVDARGEASKERSAAQERVIAEWLSEPSGAGGPGSGAQGSGVGGVGTAVGAGGSGGAGLALKQRLERVNIAQDEAQKQIENQSIPRRLEPLVRRVFQRVRDRVEGSGRAPAAGGDGGAGVAPLAPDSGAAAGAPAGAAGPRR